MKYKYKQQCNSITFLWKAYFTVLFINFRLFQFVVIAVITNNAAENTLIYLISACMQVFQ